MRYPTEFQVEPTPLTANLGESGNEALTHLRDKGFEVYTGLSLEIRKQLGRLACEEVIYATCWNDKEKRFGDDEMAKKWMQKGRGLITLQRRDEIVGYGWTGPGTDDTYMPGGEVTAAFRLGEGARGQRLATPFTEVVTKSASALYDGRNVWLETWRSNVAANKAYEKVGYEEVVCVNSLRKTKNSPDEPDIRRFMRYPNELLPPFEDKIHD